MKRMVLFPRAEIMEKRLFVAGFMLSLLIHAVTMAFLSLSSSDAVFFRRPFKPFEITYRDLTSPPKNKTAAFKDLDVVRDPASHQKQRIKVLAREGGMFAAIGERIKDISKLGGTLRWAREKTAAIRTLDVGKKITLSPFKAEKITNPQYLTYTSDMYAAMSRDIKRRAYAYVHHPDYENGEVYLTFVLASSGMLQRIKIIEDKTFANAYLRDVALRSIRESNPFPPFPEGFDYPEFTFHLLISFQK